MKSNEFFLTDPQDVNTAIIEMGFITLITKLGYREAKSWGDDEEEDLMEIREASKRLAERITNIRWIKTKDRLPTKEDGDEVGYVICWNIDTGLYADSYKSVTPINYSHWAKVEPPQE